MKIFGIMLEKIGLKGFVAAGMMFLLLALSGNFFAANAQGTWRLKDIHIFTDQMASHTSVKSDANSAGGYADIVVDGNPYDFCRDGVEVLRFTWQFEYDVSQANPGGFIGVNLAGGQIQKSAHCKTSIAQMSIIKVLGSGGGGNPYSSDFTRYIDGSRFATGNGLQIAAAEPYQQTGIGSVQMMSHRANSATPYAFFMIYISVRGGGSLKVAYLYELVG